MGHITFRLEKDRQMALQIGQIRGGNSVSSASERSERSAAVPTALIIVMLRKWSISSWQNWRIW